MGIVAAGEALVFIIAALFLRAGCDVFRCIRPGDAVFICAVCLGVGVLIPENDGEASRGRRPLGRILVVVRGHGLGQFLIPPGKRITGLGRRADGDGRAVAGVNRLHAVAAVEVEVQQVIIPVILDVYNGAAVCGDAHRAVIQQAVEAIVLFGKIPADFGICKADLGLGIYKGIVVVVGVLLVVTDGKADLRGVVINIDRHISAYIYHIYVNFSLLGFWRIADYGGADDRGGVAASRGERGRPRVGRLLARILFIPVNIFYRDIICIRRCGGGVCRRRFIRINR